MSHPQFNKKHSAELSTYEKMGLNATIFEKNATILVDIHMSF